MLRVIYLVFNEGYFATSGDSLTRGDLSGEAIRLGRLLVGLLPDGETYGLFMLMLLTESCRAARSTARGDIVLLEDQDRSLWDPALIREGLELVDSVLARGELVEFHLAHAVRADFYRRLGRDVEARAAYRRALELARQGPERRLIRRRLSELGE